MNYSRSGIIGDNLFQSLLIMLNQIKSDTLMPDLTHLADIIAVYKGRGRYGDMGWVLDLDF